MLEWDEDDRYITESFFKENDISVNILFKKNSTDFFSYLDNCSKNVTSYPSLILLDMNAVPLDATEILKKLKSSKVYNHVPVVILSEIPNTRLIKECYALGASSFISKPGSSELTNKKILTFFKYWFETVELAQ